MPNKFEDHVATGKALAGASFPGGYPIIYVTDRNECLCADCATKRAQDVTAHNCHMEGPPLTCDGCGAEIESAYGEPDKEGDHGEG